MKSTTSLSRNACTAGFSCEQSQVAQRSLSRLDHDYDDCPVGQFMANFWDTCTAILAADAAKGHSKGHGKQGKAMTALHR